MKMKHKDCPKLVAEETRLPKIAAPARIAITPIVKAITLERALIRRYIRMKLLLLLLLDNIHSVLLSD